MVSNVTTAMQDESELLSRELDDSIFLSLKNPHQMGRASSSVC